MMRASKEDRLRECRVLGTMAGIAGGVAFWMYFVGEIFDVTQRFKLLEIDIVAWALVVCILAPALGLGGLAGQWLGGQVIYPIRTGDDATATKRMWLLIVLGGVGTIITFVAALLWRAILAHLAAA